MKEKARSRARAMRWPGGGKPSRRRLDELGGPRAVADRVEIDGLPPAHRRRRRAAPRCRRSRPPAPGRDAVRARRSAASLADAAEQLDADPVEGRPDHREMPRARDAVEDHAGDADIVAEVGAAQRRPRPPSRSGPSRRAPARPASRATPPRSDVAPRPPAPSNRPITPSVTTRSAGWRATRSRQQRRRHRPAVEIEARPARRRRRGRRDRYSPARICRAAR